MKMTRRMLVLLALLVVPLLPSAGQDKPGRSTTPRNYFAYLGTYTTKTDSKGIYAYRFDAATGKLTVGELAAESTDPSFVIVHPNGGFLYAVNEAGKNSMVSAFAREPKTGKLTLLNQLPALGEDPCYISFDKTGKYVLVANYTSGNVVVFPILPDGRLGEHTALVSDSGTTGPNKERQEGPHAHWIETSAGNTSVFVADLGLDRVLVYGFDSASGKLWAPAERAGYPHNPLLQETLVLQPGTGPRHVAFSRFMNSRHFVYVLGELDSTITVFSATKEGVFNSAIQKISTLPAGFRGRNDTAEIAIHPNGKFLFASNRGHDTIAVFRINPTTGRLTAAGDFSVEGKEPRHFAIDPSGKYLMAENQLSNTIVVFKIDPSTGSLTPTGQSVLAPATVCIAFTPAE
jgi:6-phosphogluconolactonase